MVGCGNSSMPICFYLKEIFIELSEDMYNSQYTNITNIDISDVVIEKMKKIYSESMPLWNVFVKMSIHLVDITMDALNMDFPPNSFKLVIDKGTYDALAVIKK